ncbi:MAG: UDP-N-acetylmuramoyl-tripeptide--D-alanyl-D-alanine ligase, partial [Abditibacteriota bacterium]|nr:UDP-N-acetylmuramoyl-tripeptide--D-alanyl-D-alanine ligase [Abditibacteriota bacterium]
ALGDMLELGEKSDALHKIVGEAAKDTGIDILICIGTSAKYIAEGAAGGKAEIYRFDTSDEAAEFVKKIVRPGDAVLAKGSHAIATEKIPEALK